LVRYPLLLYLSSLAEAAPLGAVVAARRRVGGARKWMVVWSTLLFAESVITYALATRGIHNLWVPYLFTPVTAAAVLWALAWWQTSGVARLTIRLSIAPLLVVWLTLTLAFESASSFSRAADPLVQLVELSAAAYTLVVRSRAAAGDLLQQDWFWVSAGLVLYLGTFSMIGPLSALLARTDTVLMLRAYQFEAVLQILAFVAIARGMTCPAAA
jgi:hypothetical protein